MQALGLVGSVRKRVLLLWQASALHPLAAAGGRCCMGVGGQGSMVLLFGSLFLLILLIF